MMLLDTHAHLDFEAFQSDLGQLLDRAWNAGLTHIVTIGSGQDADSAERAVQLSSQHERIWATVGIHPHDAALGIEWQGNAQAKVHPDTLKQWELKAEAVMDRLRQLSLHPKVRAIGEAGLDYHYDRSPRELQKRMFQLCARLSKERQLPLVVHAREAEPDIIRILKTEGVSAVSGVVHCFSGDAQLARAGLELGFYFGIGGTLTFNNAHALRKIVADLPIERLVLETDCPYLAPVPHRGKRNEPAYVSLVAKKLAELKGESPEKIAETTSENARKLFGIPPKELFQNGSSGK